MVLYIFVAIFPLIVSAFYTERVPLDPIDEKMIKKRRFRRLLLASLPMFILIAFRSGSIGADTLVYQTRFAEIVNTSWSHLNDDSRMEYGFLVFTKLITYITHNALVYQIIYTAIYWLTISDFINQLEKGHFLCLYFFATIGLYVFMFTGVRQCLAMCICLFSYRFVKSRKIIPFAVLMVIAFYFHKSSVLFLSAYVLYGVSFNIITIIGYIIATAIAFVNLEILQEWFNDQLEYDYGLERVSGGIISFLIILIVTVFSAFFILNNKYTPRSAFSLLNISVVTLICWILRLATRIAERPSYYFMFFLVAVLAYAIEQLGQTKERTVIKWCVISLFMAYYMYRMSNVSNMLPYEFY